MKTLLGALALVIAAPVAAQTPTADSHAERTGHSQQQPEKSFQPAGQDHKHMMDCCDEYRDSMTKAPGEHARHNH